MVSAFSRWKRYDETRQNLAKVTTTHSNLSGHDGIFYCQLLNAAAAAEKILFSVKSGYFFNEIVNIIIIISVLLG